MESRGPSAPPPHHQQHHQPPHQHPQPPQGMMLQHHHHHQQQHQQHHQHQQHQQHQHQHQHHQHHQHHHHPSNSSYPSQSMPNSSPNPPQMIATPNSSSSSMLQNNRFPFTSQVITTTPPPSKTQLEPLNSPYSGDGLRSSGFGIDPNSSSSQKKKRGRPRKYSPDGGGSNIALGLAPTPMSSSIVAAGVAAAGGQADSSGTAPSSENPSKRHRGRPPGSSKKQLDALGNCGVGFTPHVILVNAGEDIASKIIAFSKQGPRTVCVLSANGSICNVNLRQPTSNGGVVQYEGRFEIISLSGSFLFSENSGGLRTGGLSISLAGADGRVVGGGVAGMLMAATPVQIIVGSFIANGKKTKYMPSVPQSHVLSFTAPPLQAAESPPSQDASSEGSEENGSNHIDRTMGSFGNSNHPMHNMQMYNPMGWPNSASKMLQN
ncbi:AT-hook motif nuclear-localized protein 13 [Bienertia sinuspersici]